MASRKLDVRIGSRAIPVGELIYEKAGAREVSVFTYHASWLANAKAFPIAPDMPLQSPPFFNAKSGNASALPGAVADGAPDSWGCAIIKAALGGRVESDLTYLVESSDALRSGALRYFDKPGTEGIPLAPPPVSGDVTIPRLLDMDDVVAAARAFEADPIRYRETRAKTVHGDLLKNAIGSLGGARPKVNARDEEGNLWIVKLPKMGDQYAVARAEVLALRLAKRVGIQASEVEILSAGDKFPIAAVRRFDRVPSGRAGVEDARLPFISAQTFMGLRGTEPGNYVDMAEMMVTHCLNHRAQVRELLRRITFGILIQNTDDHLRNHGFILTNRRHWVLSPAFDINPDPDGGTLKTAISDIHGNELSIGNLIAAAPYFEVGEDEAREMAVGMARIVTDEWRRTASSLGMSARDIRAIVPAMENAQIREALSLGKSIVPSASAPSP